MAELYDSNKDTISGDFDAIRNAGFILEYDKHYKYAFSVEKQYKQLKDLLHFSEEEQLTLFRAIDQLNPDSKKEKVLKEKLHSLYDFRKPGNVYLRKPYLSKIDLLYQFSFVMPDK